MELRIGHLSTFYHTAIILMAEGAINKRLSCDVEWKLFGTGPAIVNSFKKRELDMAYIGLPPAIIGIDKGVEIRCVAGGHIEGTVVCGKKKYNGFPEIDDLKEILKQFCGSKIGVPGRGSIHDVILTESLDRFNLKNEIEVINFKWSDEVTEAIARDEIAAAVGTPALAVAIERYANGRVLYPASRLWPDNPSCGIVVHKTFLNQHRDTVEKFLILHEKATALLRNSPGKAAKIISDYVGFIDAGFILDMLKLSPKYCAQLTDSYISTTMEFVKILEKLGYISRKIPAREIFDTSLIKKIHPEKDHY